MSCGDVLVMKILGNTFGNWMVAFAILISSSWIVASVVEGTDQGFQLTFDANEALLEEMTQEMSELLDQIEEIHRRGGLPTIELPLNIRIETFDLLKGFMNGINIPLLVNIGGIGHLNEALFDNYTYSTLLSGSLAFPNGILNGSNAVNGERLPQQSRETQIAAQEYLLYVTDAIRGALRLILLMDMDENSVDIVDMLEGATSFLAFNTRDLNQKRDAMYRSFGRETVSIGNLRTSSRSISDIVRNADGEGYNLLIDLRNFLLGGQTNVDILVDVLEYAERVVHGEIVEKYHYIDFDSTDAGVDQTFDYLISDAKEVQHVLTQLEQLTEPFATLLNEAESEIIELAFSQIPDSLDFFLPGLFDDIDSVEDVVEYLDTVIAVLEEMRSGAQGIGLGQGRRFVTETLSGEILDRYLILQDKNGQHLAPLLHHLKEDLDSLIAVFETVDLVDREFVPLLGGKYLSDLVKEYIIIIAPGIIDTQLDLLLVDFEEWDVGSLGIGEAVIEVLTPVILSFEMAELVEDLRVHSETVSRLIPVAERSDHIEQIMMETFSLYEEEE